MTGLDAFFDRHVEALRAGGFFGRYNPPLGNPSPYLHSWDKDNGAPGTIHYLGDVPYTGASKDMPPGSLRQEDASLKRQSVKGGIAAYMPPEAYFAALDALVADPADPAWKMAQETALRDLGRAISTMGRKRLRPEMLDGLRGAAARDLLTDLGLARNAGAHPELVAGMVLYEAAHFTFFKAFDEALARNPYLADAERSTAEAALGRLRSEFISPNYYKVLMGAMLFSLEKERLTRGDATPAAPEAVERAIAAGAALFFEKDLLRTAFAEPERKNHIDRESGKPIEQICPALAHLKHTVGRERTREAGEPMTGGRVEHGATIIGLYRTIRAEPERFTPLMEAIRTVYRGEGLGMGGR